jgi:hypothetical protein
MTNMRTSKNFRRSCSLLGLVFVAVLFVINPRGLTSGGLDTDPYSSIRSEMAKSKNSKVLLLSSFDDFYSMRSNHDLRREFGEGHVERGYSEVLSAASLGDEIFNRFLENKGVTHILVPLSTSQRGEIRYKWGEMGTVRIQLTKPYFTLVTGTAGDFPVVLYKVQTFDMGSIQELDDPSYVINWGDGVRSEFHQVIRSLTEKGMYSYEYGKSYENGLDVSWVFSYPRSTDGLPDIQEVAEFQYHAESPEMENVTAEVTLIAAYGPSAPTQIIRVVHNGVSTAYKVTASMPAEVKLRLRNGDKVKFSSVLPCQPPQVFEPSDDDWRKYCFGISDIRVRL